MPDEDRNFEMLSKLKKWTQGSPSLSHFINYDKFEIFFPNRNID